MATMSSEPSLVTYESFGFQWESGRIPEIGRFEKMLLVACKGEDRVEEGLLDPLRRTQADLWGDFQLDQNINKYDYP